MSELENPVTGEELAPAEAAGDAKKNFVRELLSWVLCFVCAFAAATLLNRYVLYNALVVSGSMERTLMTNDRVIGLRCAYWFKDPQRGDVIIFDNKGEGERVMVKRVIGVPGDTVGIVNGVVYVNGEELDEPYLAEPMTGSFGPYEVPEGRYFLMGDNRNHSSDSRRWAEPFIPREDISAKAVLVYWKGIRLVK